jgi:hypothetical protein|tara:strand:- start:68 stop:364 length:297 start_codon:yes stop_codon:yes gene_type:complete
MATSRYAYTPVIMGRSRLATSMNGNRIFNATVEGNLSFSTIILKENQRLDHIAGEAYGSAALWWIIAAASGVGWGLQLPPGTILRVPRNLSKVMALIR